jgi:hypothetical protein
MVPMSELLFPVEAQHLKSISLKQQKSVLFRDEPTKSEPDEKFGVAIAAASSSRHGYTDSGPANDSGAV